MAIKQLSIVKLEDWYIDHLKKYNDRYRFTCDTSFIYLGEIPNLPGYCVIAGTTTGKIYSGYHIENFRVATEEEV